MAVGIFMCVLNKSYKRISAIALVLLGASVASAEDKSTQADTQQALFEGPTMEVVFVLDTTGSMSGLIDGAKRKIWSIAEKLKSAKPTPTIKFGLIGYRDRGDEYITRLYGLDENIDTVYANLMQFQANGGGDEPESVNQALHEAVTLMQWNEKPGTLRTIFLVGDARPHMDYQDDVKYNDSCLLAQAKGILVNTIQCGNLSGTAKIWNDISNKTNGSYAAILQSGGTITVDTPWDNDIIVQNEELDTTIIPYGSRKERAYAADNTSLLAIMSAETVADRWSFLNKSGKGKVIAGSGDLIELVISGRITIETIDHSKLPKDLQKLSEEELKQLIEKNVSQREQLQSDIDANVVKRAKYIDDEMEKLTDEERDEVFELSAFQVLEVQAKAAGFEFKK